METQNGRGNRVPWNKGKHRPRAVVEASGNLGDSHPAPDVFEHSRHDLESSLP
ncbi:hypothetical protein [Paraburkholderia heleia]|uniref:hypothetical protein n=1 Tax=Paraburkholderia heleia TaxID=634127 RepID=UPI003CD065D5